MPLVWNYFNANSLNLGCNEPSSIALFFFLFFFKWILAKELSRTVSASSEHCKHLTVVLVCPIAGQDP